VTSRENDRLDAAVRAFRRRLGDHGHHVTLAERDAARHFLAAWRDSEDANDILTARIGRVIDAVVAEAARVAPECEITRERLLGSCRWRWAVEWRHACWLRLAGDGVTARQIAEAFSAHGARVSADAVQVAVGRLRRRAASDGTATNEVGHG
jgi:hypothetical protein